MKYIIALAALLSTTSFAQEIPEFSFEGIGAIEELSVPLVEKYGLVAQDVQASIKELFNKYNPFSLMNNHAQAAGTTTPEITPIQKDTVVSAVAALTPLNDPSELSLFTTVKNYIMTRPYKIGAATLATAAALAGGAFYMYSKNK